MVSLAMGYYHERSGEYGGTVNYADIFLHHWSISAYTKVKGGWY